MSNLQRYFKNIDKNRFTNYSKRDKLKLRSKNNNKGNNKMNNKIQNQIKNIQESTKENKAVQQFCLFAKTVKRTALIYGSAGLAYYLVTNFDDFIILVIASAVVLFNIVKVVNSAYNAELPKKRR